MSPVSKNRAHSSGATSGTRPSSPDADLITALLETSDMSNYNEFKRADPVREPQREVSSQCKSPENS